jgi:cellulose biosynthesis protein BcsQ
VSQTLGYQLSFNAAEVGVEQSETRRRSRRSSGIAITADQQNSLVKVRALGPKAVCFFNNKGGVGKTTLVANLAAELAKNYSAKILVVDADPQCNLSQYVLDEEQALDVYTSSGGDFNSIYSVIRPLALGKGYQSELPVRASEVFGFDIVIGDPRLALQEDLLAQDWRDAKAGGMRGIQTTFVFADLVERAKEKSYDFVFFDMGPSLGAINRSILLAMDYFVVPMSIDIFSQWALRNIGSTVKAWHKELTNGLRLSEDPREFFENYDFLPIRFLGYVTQQHKERLEVTGEADVARLSKNKKIVKAYDDIAQSFPDEVQKHLGGFFANKNMVAELGRIRNLGSLAPKSQSQHEPMVTMSAKGSLVQLRKQAREIYRGITENFLNNIVLAN